MSIEIKQLHIKSNVVQRADEGKDDGEPSEEMVALKQELLAECKDLILDTLRDLRER
jgi:hypothetical protein